MKKVAGSAVYAGTINQTGALEIRTERIGRDTSYGRIIAAVEEAERSRAPVQRLADRLAAYLVYFALTAALVTFAARREIRPAIAVVIVGGRLWNRGRYAVGTVGSNRPSRTARRNH